MFAFSGSSRNNKKICSQSVVHFLSYGAIRDSPDVAIIHRYFEDTTTVSDGSASDNSLANEPVDILDLTACEGASGTLVCFASDITKTDGQPQNFEARLDSFESDDESSSIIKSVTALEHTKKFTDSETTALTVRSSDLL
jgi:hypothetical protein